MSVFTVYASVTYVGWIDVEADTRDEAWEAAQDADPCDFEIDTATAEVEFNIEPQVVGRA